MSSMIKLILSVILCLAFGVNHQVLAKIIWDFYDYPIIDRDLFNPVVLFAIRGYADNCHGGEEDGTLRQYDLICGENKTTFYDTEVMTRNDDVNTLPYVFEFDVGYFLDDNKNPRRCKVHLDIQNCDDSESIEVLIRLLHY